MVVEPKNNGAELMQKPAFETLGTNASPLKGLTADGPSVLGGFSHQPLALSDRFLAAAPGRGSLHLPCQAAQLLVSRFRSSGIPTLNSPKFEGNQNGPNTAVAQRLPHGFFLPPSPL